MLGNPVCSFSWRGFPQQQREHVIAGARYLGGCPTVRSPKRTQAGGEREAALTTTEFACGSCVAHQKGKGAGNPAQRIRYWRGSFFPHTNPSSDNPCASAVG